MTLPPMDMVFRLWVKKEGGTEDGIAEKGQIHVRGDIDDPPEAHAVRLIEERNGYWIAEIVDDASPEEAVNLHEWREKQKEKEKNTDIRQKRFEVKRMKASSVQTEVRNPRHRTKSSPNQEEESDKKEDSDDPRGNKNHLLNGNL